MSVIVWDGTTLAADRQATNHNMRRTVVKISKHGDLLVGVVGDYVAAQAVKAWLVSGADIDAFPKDLVSEDASVMVVNRDGQIMRFENSPFPVMFEDKVMAEGTGRDFAMGALAAGADAVKAVEIACVYDIYCGGGIDRLTFD